MNKNNKRGIIFSIHFSTIERIELPFNGVLIPEEDPLNSRFCVTVVLAPLVFSPLPVVKGLKTWDSSQVDV